MFSMEPYWSNSHLVGMRRCSRRRCSWIRKEVLLNGVAGGVTFAFLFLLNRVVKVTPALVVFKAILSGSVRYLRFLVIWRMPVSTWMDFSNCLDRPPGEHSESLSRCEGAWSRTKWRSGSGKCES